MGFFRLDALGVGEPCLYLFRHVVLVPVLSVDGFAASDRLVSEGFHFGYRIRRLREKDVVNYANTDQLLKHTRPHKHNTDNHNYNTTKEARDISTMYIGRYFQTGN